MTSKSTAKRISALTDKPTDVLAELDDIASLYDYQDYRDKVASIRAKFSALVEAARPIAHFTTAVRARSGPRGDGLIRIECEAGVFVLRVSELRALSSALRSAGQ